ncbi:Uncharacterized protein FKW44_024874 [Caligus rogercresseyi]|uniref:EF-hand domain-containing protein n=1 Tax=Caligus rogercresseyi TaxID=217165 RepID=A0A7T8GMP1_CALRO|nr:Uncharacterized protein FKW44_024874 [Caligus rogercresseyi]
MFNIVDKDNDSRISFQEFLDTIVLFSKGRTDDKLRIIFDMCDDDKTDSSTRKSSLSCSTPSWTSLRRRSSRKRT